MQSRLISGIFMPDKFVEELRYAEELAKQDASAVASAGPIKTWSPYWGLYYNLAVIRWFIFKDTAFSKHIQIFIYEWLQEHNEFAHRFDALVNNNEHEALLLEANQSNLYRMAHAQDAVVIPHTRRRVRLLRRDHDTGGCRWSIEEFPLAVEWLSPENELLLLPQGWEYRAVLTPAQRSAMEERYQALQQQQSQSIRDKYKNLGFDVASEEVLAQRRSICGACEHYDNVMRRCAKCGCSSAKLVLASATCPIGKW